MSQAIVACLSPNFGDKVSYTVTVSNDGSADSNNLVVVDTLDPGLVFVGASDGGLLKLIVPPVVNIYIPYESLI